MDNKNVFVIDNIRYLIIERVNHEDKTFAYLINSSDEKDTMFVELKENSVKEIPRDYFLTEIFPLFVDKFSKE